MQLNHKIIFWDWNGTLLSDADACVEAMNSMLIDRRKKRLTWMIINLYLVFLLSTIIKHLDSISPLNHSKPFRLSLFLTIGVMATLSDFMTEPLIPWHILSERRKNK
jgi:hypothetical protein